MRYKKADIKPYGICNVIEFFVEDEKNILYLREVPEDLIRDHIAAPFCALDDEERYDEPLYPQTEQYHRFRDEYVCLVDLWNTLPEATNKYLHKKSMISHIVALIDIYSESFNAVLALGSIGFNRSRPDVPLPLSLTSECRGRIREMKAEISKLERDAYLRKLRNKVACHSGNDISRKEAHTLQIHVKRFDPEPYVRIFGRWHNYNAQLPIHGWRTTDFDGSERYHFQTSTIAGRWFGIVPGENPPTARKMTFRILTNSSLECTDKDLHEELWRAWEDPLCNDAHYDPLCNPDSR